MYLSCRVQSYDWGKIGGSSEVALLAQLNSGIEIDRCKSYAELWMGTHPNGPSIITSTGEPLLSWLKKNPTALGDSLETFGHDLPFLLKVLSINKPLSIQAHPTKAHAEELFKKDPANYKDSNHKPEMAIALTPFEALLGFCPANVIKYNFKNIPELAEIIGEDKVKALLESENIQPALKSCFQTLMNTDPSVIENVLSNLMSRLKSSDAKTRTLQKASLVERLYSYFPGDVGVFGAFFFNNVHLKPGEAIFLAANEPHAYISGDCVECMACSDNVVRAGLTPKYKDVDTLCEMLTYNCASADEMKFIPMKEDFCTTLFSPPVPDFAVASIEIPQDYCYTLIKRKSASVFIVICGSAESSEIPICKGTVLFLPANETLTIQPTECITLYQAFPNYS